MIKTISLFLLVTQMSISHAQVDVYKKSLEDKILNLKCGSNVFYFSKIRKRYKNSMNFNISLFHVLNLQSSVNRFSKENFLDYSFLQSLSPLIVRGEKKSEKYIDASTTIVLGNKVYDAERGNIYYYSNQDVMKPNLEQMRLATENKITLKFYIYGTNSAITFGLSENKVFVFERVNDSVKIHNLNDYINCCWNNIYIGKTY